VPDPENMTTTPSRWQTRFVPPPKGSAAEKLATELNKLRGARHLTFKELHLRTGGLRDRGTLSRMLQGRSALTLDVAEAVAGSCGYELQFTLTPRPR